MDPVTIAIIARESIKTALQIRDIFKNNSEEDAEELFARLLVEIKTNQSKVYSDYDPTLDSDIAASLIDRG